MTVIRQRQNVIRNHRSLPDQTEWKIVETSSENELTRIWEPEVQAVIYKRPQLPSWNPDLAHAVESGAFQIERVVLQGVIAADISTWLDSHIPWGNIDEHLGKQFKNEILALVTLEQTLTGVSQVMIRMFTEAPTQRCGFHIDTTLPRASPFGLLRVFNGPGTFYVHPDNITKMSDFYRYFGEREQLGKDLERAVESGSSDAQDEIIRKIRTLDQTPKFLRKPDDIRQVPEGAIVVFKHLDTRFLWSDHAKGLTWIHCSPSQGPRRLVVNITPWETRVKSH